MRPCPGWGPRGRGAGRQGGAAGGSPARNTFAPAGGEVSWRHGRSGAGAPPQHQAQAREWRVGPDWLLGMGQLCPPGAVPSPLELGALWRLLTPGSRGPAGA